MANNGINTKEDSTLALSQLGLQINNNNNKGLLGVKMKSLHAMLFIQFCSDEFGNEECPEFVTKKKMHLSMSSMGGFTRNISVAINNTKLNHSLRITNQPLRSLERNMNIA